MPELNWRLRVWTPTGSGPRIIQRDTGPIPVPGEASHVMGSNGRGLRLRITPEGECVEAVFSAKGAGILLPPLSAVQVEYLYLGNWTPLYYGEVRRGGNARDVNGEDYAIVGMSRRFEEITLSPGFSAPQQPAHLTVRAIIQDVIASGQLGTPPLVQYVEALCPDLGFDCREVKDAAQQNPAALLKQISEDGAKYGVLVRWGVDPQRRFFVRPAKADTRDVTTEAPIIEWSPPVAETPCTAVLWYLAKRPDGTWVTHLSRSPDAALYGDRVKPLSVDASVNPWLAVSATYAPDAGSTATGNPAVLTDGRLYRDGAPTGSVAVVRRSGTNGGSSADMVYTLTPSGPYVRVVLDALSFDASVGLYAGGVSTPLGTVTFGERIFYNAGSSNVTLTVPITGYPDVGAQLNLIEFRADAINTALLDGLAGFHYASPAQEPADIETQVFVPPVSLPGRVRVTPADGPVYEHPLEAVEYRITNRGMQMGWLAGQADDPAALAQASLIKQRDGQAIITSLTALT